ncbi:hypothetical protein ABW21_db0208392 [Orbilia brochopaga]|nr:hypothetical protein ABW21_db0208392 [Drechslerella brochopaga]
MASLSTHGLVKLPYEVSFQILADLDKRSLKALRLAFVNSRISAATAKFLFGPTFRLRLGTPQCSFTRIRAMLACFSRPWLESDMTGGLIEAIENFQSLVLDTRYPFLVSEDDLQQHPDFIRAKNSVLERDFFSSNKGRKKWLLHHMIMAPLEERKLFIELVSLILSRAKNLQTVKWTSATVLPMHLHWDLAQLLSEQAAVKHYSLKITLSFASAISEGFLEPLSNLTSFELVGQKSIRRETWLPSTTVDDIAAVLARSQQIMACKIDMPSFSMRPGTVSVLYKAFANSKSLRSLHVNLWDNLQHEIDWSQLEHLRMAIGMRNPRDQTLSTLTEHNWVGTPPHLREPLLDRSDFGPLDFRFGIDDRQDGVICQYRVNRDTFVALSPSFAKFIEGRIRETGIEPTEYYHPMDSKYRDEVRSFCIFLNSGKVILPSKGKNPNEYIYLYKLADMFQVKLFKIAIVQDIKANMDQIKQGLVIDAMAAEHGEDSLQQLQRQLRDDEYIDWASCFYEYSAEEEVAECKLWDIIERGFGGVLRCEDSVRRLEMHRDWDDKLTAQISAKKAAWDERNRLIEQELVEEDKDSDEDADEDDDMNPDEAFEMVLAENTKKENKVQAAKRKPATKEKIRLLVAA